MLGFFPRGRRLTILLVLCTSLCAGCNVQAALQVPPPALASQTPEPGPTILPTVTPVPTVAPTASATASPAPTATPAPTISLTATPIPTPPAIDLALSAELQAILDNLVADGSIPGATLAVHIPGYAVWTGASGSIDRAGTQPMTPATRVRIASISKVFTAVVVLQLVEEGRLELDVPLSLWYPELVPGASQITVRRLLNHTTGLYDYLEDRVFLSQAYQAPGYRWQPIELAAYAGQQSALFAPGAPDSWDYSSTNYVILGMVVEAVTGNSLAAEMNARIFEPLGLDSTYFAPDDEVEGIYARGYRNESDVTSVSMSFAYATANIVSTAEDIQRFGTALFAGELLNPELMEQMLAFSDGKGQYNMPHLEYGLGVMRNKLPVGPDARGNRRSAELRTVIGHTGGFAGFRSVLWYAPASGVTIALGENQATTDPNILATSVLDAVLRAQGQ